MSRYSRKHAREIARATALAARGRLLPGLQGTLEADAWGVYRKEPLDLTPDELVELRSLLTERVEAIDARLRELELEGSIGHA